MDGLSDLNRGWASLSRRADLVEDPDRLVAAYVSPLEQGATLQTRESSVVYGRRGAGKTHALLHLQQVERSAENVVVFIDMRILGSNAGIYDNPEVPFANRATRLLIDLIETVHDALFQAALSAESGGLGHLLHQLGPALDDLGQAGTEIQVTGTISITEEKSTEVAKNSTSYTGGITAGKPTATISHTRSTGPEVQSKLQTSRQGTAEYHIHLGTLSRAVRAVCSALDGKRLWLLIDEWAEVPYELQPTLADLLKRTFFTCAGVTVKITAIEHRSLFRSPKPDGHSYIGLELGSDTGETVSLDERQAIRGSTSEMEAFIPTLLAQHMATSGFVPSSISLPELLEKSFTDGAVSTLVLASEGNPRDSLNLVAKAARNAGAGRISPRHVLEAAHDYFWNTKYKNIEGQRNLERLFSEIMAASLSRGKRTFLVLRGDARRSLYHKLYDERLIHLIRAGVRPASASGQTYDGYALDYGSYADRVLSGTLRWTNDGWTNANSFFTDGESPNWKTGVMPRRGARDE